ncbi:MAG: 50S ribosomal protein L25 [Chloroflexi bacterium]|jgi:large subunit ribosomal protein L25|nr:50S ribosomal protein L25 [Chloroflexota bacterium]
MATETVTLEAKERVVLGKKVKLLRNEGLTPIHLYGAQLQSLALQCEERALVKALASAGSNTPVMLNVEGQNDPVLTFAREIQWDPVKETILHVDFMVVDSSQKITARVPASIIGEAPGARAVSGQVSLSVRELIVEALPLEMPAEIEIDATRLIEADSVIRREDITVPEGVELIGEPDVIIARIIIPRRAPVLGQSEESIEEGAEAVTEDTTEDAEAASES